MLKNLAPRCARILQFLAFSSCLGVSAAEITLLWDDNSTNEFGFKLERSSDGSAFVQIAVTDANTTSYTDTGLTEGAVYRYRVRAYNISAHSGFSNVHEAVAQPAAAEPVFTVQPQSQTFAAGATLTLVSAATGSPDIAYQWHKDGVALAGYIDPTLTLAVAGSDDTGDYTVVATNSAGSAVSDPAHLTIAANLPPTFTVQPLSRTFLPGDTLTLISAATGSPTIVYQWYKDGAPLTGFTGPIFSQGGASANDPGTYVVTATNAAGSATSQPAVLTLASTPRPGSPINRPPLFAPVFAVQPLSQDFSAGDTVTLISAATGSPTITYQWYWNGLRLTGSTGPTFTLVEAVASHAGTYTVVATNAAGSVSSQPAQLTIVAAPPSEVPPTFVLQPVSQTIAPGGIVYFIAAAAGSPPITYQWFKNGALLYRFTEPVFTQGGASANDPGFYTVVAANSAGSTTSDAAELIVRD